MSFSSLTMLCTGVGTEWALSKWEFSLFPKEAGWLHSWMAPALGMLGQNFPCLWAGADNGTSWGQG